MATFRRDPVSSRAGVVQWSGIRKMFERARAEPGLVNLAVGQPDLDTPSHVIAAAKQALDEGHTKYAPALGYPVLREAVAAKLARENDLAVDPEREVIVTVGAMQGIMLALLAMTDAGEEVLIPDPGYPNYAGQVVLAGGVPVRVPVREEANFALRREDVEEALSPRTRAIILNTPSNPTGGMTLRPDLAALADVCQQHDIRVIADEVYEAFVYDGNRHTSMASLPGMQDRTATVMSLSKTYAMTGWRIGYVVGSARIIGEMHKLQEHMVSCVSSAVQMAAAAALTGPQDIVQRTVLDYERRRRFLVDGLNEIDGITCALPRGAFYVFPNVGALGRPAEELAEWLVVRAHIVTVPGTAFGPRGEGHLRLSYTVSMVELERALERLRQALASR